MQLFNSETITNNWSVKNWFKLFQLNQLKVKYPFTKLKMIPTKLKLVLKLLQQFSYVTLKQHIIQIIPININGVIQKFSKIMLNYNLTTITMTE